MKLRTFLYDQNPPVDLGKVCSWHKVKSLGMWIAIIQTDDGYVARIRDARSNLIVAWEINLTEADIEDYHVKLAEDQYSLTRLEAQRQKLYRSYNEIPLSPDLRLVRNYD
jgi:hypothetical protein